MSNQIASKQIAFEGENGNITLFKVGSVVRVKGQEPKMTIVRLYGPPYVEPEPVAACVWFVEGTLHEHTFELATLELAKII